MAFTCPYSSEDILVTPGGPQDTAGISQKRTSRRRKTPSASQSVTCTVWALGSNYKMTNIPFTLPLGRFILSRPSISFSVCQSRLHRHRISSPCTRNFTCLWKAVARSAYKSRQLSQQHLAYFGFHPPRPLTIYRCTNAQTLPCISCDVAIYLISLALMISLNTMANWDLHCLFSSLCINNISVRKVCEQNTC
jgi:hypothetical protein